MPASSRSRSHLPGDCGGSHSMHGRRPGISNARPRTGPNPEIPGRDGAGRPTASSYQESARAAAPAAVDRPPCSGGGRGVELLAQPPPTPLRGAPPAPGSACGGADEVRHLPAVEPAVGLGVGQLGGDRIELRLQLLELGLESREARRGAASPAPAPAPPHAVFPPPHREAAAIRPEKRGRRGQAARPGIRPGFRRRGATRPSATSSSSSTVLPRRWRSWDTTIRAPP